MVAPQYIIKLGIKTYPGFNVISAKFQLSMTFLMLFLSIENSNFDN